jgi:acetoin utilization deacetylase AcuC-like enzyme
VLAQFGPELVIVSAGFDAHERDPLASMRVTTHGYAAIVQALHAWAGGAGIALVTEGGYDLQALGECLEASFSALAGPSRDALALPPGESAIRGGRALNAVRSAQSPYWRGL